MNIIICHHVRAHRVAYNLTYNWKFVGDSLSIVCGMFTKVLSIVLLGFEVEGAMWFWPEA